MNDFMEMAIPGGVVISIFLIIFGFAAFMRYLRYKETIALAEKGLIRQRHHGANGRDTLRWGILITFVGLALSIGICPLAIFTETPEALVVGILVGLVPMFFGLGLITVHALNRKEQAEEEDHIL